MADSSSDRSLGSGAAFADLSHWTKLSVMGADAVRWLSGIVTDEIDDLAPNLARSSSFISQGGTVETEFTIAVVGGSLILVQDPERGDLEASVTARMRPGLEVEIENRTEHLALFAFPGRQEPPIAPGSAFTKPSCLGHGVDIYALISDRRRLTKLFSASFTLAENAELRRWLTVT